MSCAAVEAPALHQSGGIDCRVPLFPWEASIIRYKLMTPVEFCKSNKVLIIVVICLKSQILDAHLLGEHLSLKLFFWFSLASYDFFLRRMLHLWMLILVNDLVFHISSFPIILWLWFVYYNIFPWVDFILHSPLLGFLYTAGWYVLTLSNYIKVLFCATFPNCCAQHNNPDTFPSLPGCFHFS